METLLDGSEASEQEGIHVLQRMWSWGVSWVESPISSLKLFPVNIKSNLPIPAYVSTLKTLWNQTFKLGCST